MGFAPVLGVVGSGLSAAAQISGGQAAAEAGRSNAQIKAGQAKYVESRAAADVGRVRRGFDKFRGAFVADNAAFGGDATQGTGLLLVQEAARQAMLDQLNIVTEGSNQAQNLRNGGQIDIYEGKVARNNKIAGGLGTAIGGFTDYYKSQYGD